MTKKIIDNCTIFRLLDGMDKDTQRERCLAAFKSYNEESDELSEEKRELWNKLFLLLENQGYFAEVIDILKDLVLNKEEVRQNEVDLLIVHKRMEYLQGFISLEEMQGAIHDLMLDDYYHKAETEYRARLYDLLSRDSEDIDEALINNIKNLKEDAVKKKLNPVCKYPN